jgi:heme/copper-type cytochrome/quinol oxidase subunit 2
METSKVIIVGMALVIVTAVVMLSITGAVAFGQNPAVQNTAVGQNNPSHNTANGETQTATLTMNGGVNYIVTPSTLKVGVPVRMTVDLSTVNGCMRQVVMPSLGVNKYVSEGDNVIEFTPTKEGTFRVTCGMGMGRGTITIGSGGTIEAAPVAAAGSCGAGGGGCGCGGSRA